MKKIYIAANLSDAYIVLNLLRSENIDAHVFNQNAQSGMGELPFTHTYPEVWVAEEAALARAQAIMHKYQSTSNIAHKLCPECGEDNPGNFELCWHCAQPL